MKYHPLLVDGEALHVALGQLDDPGDAAHVVASALIGEVGPTELYDPAGIVRALLPSMTDAQRAKVVQLVGFEAATVLFGPGAQLPGAAAAAGSVKVTIPWWVWVVLIYILRKNL